MQISNLERCYYYTITICVECDLLSELQYIIRVYIPIMFDTTSEPNTERVVAGEIGALTNQEHTVR